MTGPKTNERPGTRARLSYFRTSPFKARQVLDEIRGKSYAEAAEILAFSERAVSAPIAKLLDSAVANAEHNNNQLAEELYVSACFADEGPTLKRWRPRARGRATSIHKRTCHITVIVDRYDDETLQRRWSAAESSGSAQAQASEARRRRVLQSQRAAKAESRAADAADETADDNAAEAPQATAEEKAAEIVAATAAEMETTVDTAQPGDTGASQDVPDDAASPQAATAQTADPAAAEEAPGKATQEGTADTGEAAAEDEK